MKLQGLTAAAIVQEQLSAPYTRWRHMDRMLRRLEEQHEVTQSARWSRYRSEVAREAELLPDTRERIAKRCEARMQELMRQRKPHVVEKPARVSLPIPPQRREATR